MLNFSILDLSHISRTNSNFKKTDFKNTTLQFKTLFNGTIFHKHLWEPTYWTAKINYTLLVTYYHIQKFHLTETKHHKNISIPFHASTRRRHLCKVRQTSTHSLPIEGCVDSTNSEDLGVHRCRLAHEISRGQVAWRSASLNKARTGGGVPLFRRSVGANFPRAQVSRVRVVGDTR